MKCYSIGEFAKAIGKTTKTLRNWDKVGTLKPVRVEQNVYRFYSQEQLNHFLGLKPKSSLNKKVIGY
ncbi:MAG: MerR family transcriptional regulator, partial [Clostridiaceae bacterium]